MVNPTDKTPAAATPPMSETELEQLKQSYLRKIADTKMNYDQLKDEIKKLYGADVFKALFGAATPVLPTPPPNQQLPPEKWFSGSFLTVLTEIQTLNFLAQLEVKKMVTDSDYKLRDARKTSSLEQADATYRSAQEADAQAKASAIQNMAGVGVTGASLAGGAKSRKAAEDRVEAKIKAQEAEVNTLKAKVETNKEGYAVTDAAGNKKKATPEELDQNIAAKQAEYDRCRNNLDQPPERAGARRQMLDEAIKTNIPPPPPTGAAQPALAPGGMAVAGQQQGGRRVRFADDTDADRAAVNDAFQAHKALEAAKKQKDDFKTQTEKDRTALDLAEKKYASMFAEKSKAVDAELQIINSERNNYESMGQAVTRATESAYASQSKLKDGEAQKDGILARAVAESYTESIKNTDQAEQAASKAISELFELLKQASRVYADKSSWGLPG